MLKSYLRGMFERASAHNRRNILQFVKDLAPGSFLDLGCDDGAWTLKVAEAARAKQIAGVELLPQRASLAQARQIQLYVTDLAQPLPIESDSVDLVHANQVIEHVSDVDLFTSEMKRVLKPGGSFVVSTENGSSWHNVFAAVMGWQSFSLTNMSTLRAGVGNPMALLRNESVQFQTWTHKVVFNYLGLIEFMQLHGFTDIEVKGAGYYPFPSIFGALDPRHAHFITVFGRKPN